MQLEVGAVYEGKITGITKFGAFVALPEGQSGMVHISEIANTYVNDIAEHVQMGETVKVKVIGLNDGKINLSIKKAAVPERPVNPKFNAKRTEQNPERPVGEVRTRSADNNFEDKLKKFMQESDSRIAGNPMYADRGKSRRRGR